MYCSKRPVSCPGSNGLSGILQILTFGLAGKKKVSESDARTAVNEIFLELLGRPLEAGPSAYVDCLTKGYCDFAGGSVKPENRIDAIRTHILMSPEFKRNQEKVAAKAFEELRVQGGSVPTGAAYAGSTIPGFSGSAFSSSVAGIPITYLIGGLAVLMLLKRK